MELEEVANHISAAYDSVNLINQLNNLAQPLSVENAGKKDRNIEHLKVQMSKEIFVAGLTPEQLAEINNLIKTN